LQILEDTGKILVLPVLCTSIVVPVSQPAASYYPASSTNKTDCHMITEILLKVALSTINPNLYNFHWRVEYKYNVI
jgi:hypothetical protein